MLLPIALTPTVLDTSADLSSDGGDMCDFLFEQQEAGTLAGAVDELATKKFWEKAGWSAEQQAAAVAILNGDGSEVRRRPTRVANAGVAPQVGDLVFSILTCAQY